MLLTLSHSVTSLLLQVSCKGLAGQSFDAAVAVLTAAAAEVASHCPGLLLLDDLDLITPAATGDPAQSEQVGLGCCV